MPPECAECPKCENPVRRNVQRCARCHREWHQNCAFKCRRGSKSNNKVGRQWECSDCAFPDDGEGRSPELRPSPPEKLQDDEQEAAVTSDPRENVAAEHDHPAQEVVWKCNELSCRTDQLSTEVSRLRLDNTFQKSLIRKLQVQQERHQQDILCRNLELQGVEQRPEERLPELVVRLGALLGVAVQSEDLEHCERLPRSALDRPPSIIVTLKDARVRNALLSRRKGTQLTCMDLLQDGNPEGRIFVNAHLTPYFRRLLYNTKKVAHERGYRFVWYRNGKVLVRRSEADPTVVVVQAYEDLQRICPTIDIRKLVNLENNAAAGKMHDLQRQRLRWRPAAGASGPGQGGQGGAQPPGHPGHPQL